MRTGLVAQPYNINLFLKTQYRKCLKVGVLMRLHLKWDVREISGVTQCWKALLAFYRKVLRFIHLATATAPTMEIANNVVAVVFALDLHAKSYIRSNVTILWWKKILLSIAIAVTIVYRIHSMMTPLLPSQCERALLFLKMQFCS